MNADQWQECRRQFRPRLCSEGSRGWLRRPKIGFILVRNKAFQRLRPSVIPSGPIELGDFDLRAGPHEFTVRIVGMTPIGKTEPVVIFWREPPPESLSLSRSPGEPQGASRVRIPTMVHHVRALSSIGGGPAVVER